MAALSGVEGAQGVSLWERASNETLERVLAEVSAYRYDPPAFREGAIFPASQIR
jgi:hypothetical protein